MYSSEYIPTFESDEQERIKKIKDHLNNKDLDYLYYEFNFDDNEDIVDAYFDDEDQLHIIYNTTEPEDLTDGEEHNQEEYDKWIDNLMKLYQTEPNDLTEDEIKVLVDGGYIDDEDNSRYTAEAEEVLEKIQYELSDDERLYYWDAFEASQEPDGGAEGKTIEEFWNWLEGLDSYVIEKFGDFINNTEPVNDET